MTPPARVAALRMDALVARVTPIFDVLLARHRGQRAPIRQRSGRGHEVILEIRARSRCYVVVIERRGLLHGIGDV